MNINDLLLQVESYIRLRRALGHVIASEEKELKNFIYFFSEQGGSGPIRAQIAVELGLFTFTKTWTGWTIQTSQNCPRLPLSSPSRDSGN